MSYFLAIETAGNSCSVALSSNGEVSQLIDTSERSHARRLLPMVDELLSGHGIRLSQLDGIALGIGPGSFTGIRIGMGAVQGLAFGADLPVWGVSTLYAMAAKAIRDFAVNDGTVAVALDARMGQVYCVTYTVKKGAIVETLLKECAVSPGIASEHMKHKTDVAVGSGVGLISEYGLNAAHMDASLAADAEIIAILSPDMFRAGQFISILDVEINYIRTEISWKKHQRIRQPVTR